MTSSKSTAEQSFNKYVLRDEESPAGGGDTTGWRTTGKCATSGCPPRPRKYYGECQCLRNTGRKSTRKSASTRASTEGRQPGCGGKTEEGTPRSPAIEQGHHRSNRESAGRSASTRGNTGRGSAEERVSTGTSASAEEER